VEKYLKKGINEWIGDEDFAAILKPLSEKN
jgi:hypothetical protein